MVALVVIFLYRRRPSRRVVRIPVSKVAAAIGIHPYETSQHVWHEISCPPEQREPASQEQLYGIQQEPVALEVYKALRGGEKNISIESGANRMLLSPSMTYLRGYADGLVYDLNTNVIVGVLEVKTRAGKKKKKKEDDRDGKDGKSYPDPPVVPYQRLEDMFYHIPQVQLYMHMTGASYCDLMSFTPRGSTIFRIPRDDDLIGALQWSLDVFFSSVSCGHPLDEHSVDWRSMREHIRLRCLNCPWQPMPLCMDQDLDIWD